MHEDQIYEFIEEADSARTMELLDTVVNRFRELHDDWELILLTLPKNDRTERKRLLKQAVQMLQEQENQGQGKENELSAF